MPEPAQTLGRQFRLNDAQRRHLAQTCQILANGQLGYFGYRMVTQRRLVPLLLSVVLFFFIEGVALTALRGIRAHE